MSDVIVIGGNARIPPPLFAVGDFRPILCSVGSLRSPITNSEWSAYFGLRWRILRQPWGQPLGSERDKLEDSAFHLAIFDASGHPLACGRLHLNSAVQGQIRYMAVDDNARNWGYGSQILAALEEEARRLGVTEIVLNAREAAEKFYRNRGYIAVGPAAVLFGAIPHVNMRKLLM